MPITGTYGIFGGGSVALNAAASRIDIGATLLSTLDGQNVGFGKGGRQVRVRFGAPEFNFSIDRPSDLDSPLYTMDVETAAGFGYIVFDPVVAGDLIVTRAPSPSAVIFCRVDWPAGATSMSQLVVSYDERHESRVMAARNPMEAEDLYANGEDFGDVGFNAPLVSMSILSQVLESELRARSGDKLEVVLASRAHLVRGADTLTVKPLEVAIRDRDGGADVYRLINTRQDATFVYDVPTLPASSRIYVWIDRVGGTVGSGLAYDPEDGVLAAYGDVPPGAATMQDVIFTLASEVSPSSAQSGAEVERLRVSSTSGFVSPVAVRPVSQPNRVRFDGGMAVVNGIQVTAPSEDVALPAAPVSGSRLDLIFLEVYRVVEASPPGDGSFYVALSGVGYLVNRVKVRVAADVGFQFGYPERMMLEPSVMGVGGQGFVPDPAGHFTSPYFDEVEGEVAYDGFSWAIPLACVFRFNQGAWDLDNPRGGVSRPDGKGYELLHADEIMTLAPVVALEGRNYEAIFGAAFASIVRGTEPTAFERGLMDPLYFSKRPLQVDRVAQSGAGPLLASPDGLRRQWSAKPEPYAVGASFAVNADKVTDPLLYEDGARRVTIKAPAGGKLLLVDGQPKAEALWADTGAPVTLTAWSGGDATVATADVTDARTTGTISLTFWVIQEADSFLSRVPERFWMTLNGEDVEGAEAGAPPAVIADGSTSRIVTPFGSRFKADATQFLTSVVSTGTDSVNIPTFVPINGVSRQVLGVVEATLDGAQLPIKAVRLGDLAHAVQFPYAVATGAVVGLKLALAGRAVSLKGKNLAIDEIGEANMHQATVAGGQAEIFVALPDNRVLLGLLGYVADPAQGLIHGAYLDGTLYPVAVEGFDRNLVKLTVALSQEQFDALSAADQANWAGPAGGPYLLKAGSHQLRIALLWSRTLGAGDALNVIYQHRALPFMPLLADTEFTLVARGRVLASTSSPANAWEDKSAPMSMRFPLLAGERLGAENVTPSTVILDPMDLGQDGELPIEGTAFRLNGALKFHAGVFDPDSGFVAWCALVRVGRYLRVLTYVVEGDTFTVNNPSQAFLSHPLTLAVE